MKAGVIGLGAMGMPITINLHKAGRRGGQLVSLPARAKHDTGELRTRFSRVALHAKDLTICKQMAADLRAQLPVVEMTLIHYQRLMEAGYGDEDISALFRLKQRLFEEGK